MSQHIAVSMSDLNALSHMARTILDCDGVIIAVWGSGPTMIGAVGVSKEDAQELTASFHPDRTAIDDITLTDAPASPVGVDNDRLSMRASLSRLGYRSMTRSALTLNGSVVGLLFALSVDDKKPDGGLVTAIVRSCESALEFGRDPAGLPHLPDIDSLALHAESFPTLMPAVRSIMSDAIGPVDVGMSILDDESGLLVTEAGSFNLDESVTTSYWIDPSDLHSNAARVFEMQRPFASNHVIGDPAVIQAYPIAFGIESMIALPLVVAGKSKGVLMVANKENGFRPSDVDIASSLAPRIAVAVELARLGTAKRLRFASEQLLAELSAKANDPIVNITRIRPVLEQLARIIRASELDILATGASLLHIDTGIRPIENANRRFELDFPCGNSNGSALRIQAIRDYGSDFSRNEKQLVREAAGLIAEGLARTHAIRQEIELVQHRERQRIADDLHDDVSQLLFAAQLTLEPGIDHGIDGDAARKASELVRRAEVALRDAIFLLNTPHRTLSAGIDEVVSSIRDDWDLEVSVSIDTSIDSLVTTATSNLLIRSTREALMNVVKHAGPCTVTVEVALNHPSDGIRIVIRDTGRGISSDVSPIRTSGHGLASLRRRITELGGSVTVTSQPNIGTTVTLGMPLSLGIEPD